MLARFCPIVPVLACQRADGHSDGILVSQSDDFVDGGFQIGDGDLLPIHNGGYFVEFVLPDEYDVVMRLSGELLSDVGRGSGQSCRVEAARREMISIERIKSRISPVLTATCMNS